MMVATLQLLPVIITIKILSLSAKILKISPSKFISKMTLDQCCNSRYQTEIDHVSQT